MSPDLYGLLAARARGRCECRCGRPVPPGEVDHFFGRAKADEVEFNCWILTPECHRAKTDSRPSAAHWLLAFIAHCGRYAGEGYALAAARAQQKLEWTTTKRGFA